MALQIVVNQFGKPAGVAGQAREDLDLGVPVVLSTSGGPFAQYRWTIVSKPVDLLTSFARSAAGLATATASTTQLTPIDLQGTYLIELAVDSGAGLGARDTDVVRITFYAGTALATDPRFYPRREPAFGERTEHNVPDIIDPSGNPEGWAREKLRQYLGLKDLFMGRLWAGAYIDSLGAIVRQYNVASVTIGFGAYLVTYATALPDNNYSIFVTPGNGVLTVWPVPVVQSRSASNCLIRFTDAAIPGPLIAVNFSIRIELGVDPL